MPDAIEADSVGLWAIRASPCYKTWMVSLEELNAQKRRRRSESFPGFPHMPTQRKDFCSAKFCAKGTGGLRANGCPEPEDAFY